MKTSLIFLTNLEIIKPLIQYLKNDKKTHSGGNRISPCLWPRS
jgi:hypothetical protein